MGLEKRTVRIIVFVVVTLLVIGGIVGLILGLLLYQRYVDLEVWPRDDNYYYTWDEPVIQFRPNDPGTWQPWVHRINHFLRVYETTVPEFPPRAPCSIHHHQEQHMRSPACHNAMRKWHPCTVDEFYGYPAGTPCIFLRLNHIHYWVPEPYNMTFPHLSLPPDMPLHLRQIIVERPAFQYGDFAWVSCEGEYANDKENIGVIQYIPADEVPGFPLTRLHTADRIPRGARHLPDQEPGPLVAVLFENPRRGMVINVECRVWTRDLYPYYDRSSRYGRARFELVID